MADTPAHNLKQKMLWDSPEGLCSVVKKRSSETDQTEQLSRGQALLPCSSKTLFGSQSQSNWSISSVSAKNSIVRKTSMDESDDETVAEPKQDTLHLKKGNPFHDFSSPPSSPISSVTSFPLKFKDQNRMKPPKINCPLPMFLPKKNSLKHWNNRRIDVKVSRSNTTSVSCLFLKFKR
jgi:hypothetical protein